MERLICHIYVEDIEMLERFLIGRDRDVGNMYMYKDVDVEL